MIRTGIILSAVLVMADSFSMAQTRRVDYNPDTGNIVFRGLISTSGLHIKGPGIPAVNPDDLGGFVDTSIRNELSWLFYSPKNGDIDGGNLFPVGLYQTEIEAIYFAGYDIAGSGYPDPWRMPIIGGLEEEVPEPDCLCLFSVLTIAIILARIRAKGLVA